jgi:hypothetical protein
MIILIEHDSGIDGWDARSNMVAVYENSQQAIGALEDAGYTHFENGYYYHGDRSKRYGMNSISYKLSQEYQLNKYNFPYK